MRSETSRRERRTLRGPVTRRNRISIGCGPGGSGGPGGRGVATVSYTHLDVYKRQFYLFPPVFGMLGRVYLPSLPAGTRADSVVLLLPSAMAPGTLGDLLSAILAGGAFAAFLSTASGLTVSVAGVIDQDLLSGAMNRRLGGDLPRTHSFRLASVVAILIPYAASWLAPSVTLADTVGMAFAIAASTFCPLLILGVWSVSYTHLDVYKRQP